MTQPTPFSEDAFNNSLSYIKKLWSGMNAPGTNASGTPAMPSMGMPMPTMSLEELDKRIQDLKSVEAWLNMNTTMLRSTVQALEIQRATIATLHSLSSTMAQTMQSSSGTTSEQADKDSTKTEDKERAPNPEMSPLISQSTAWWNTLQEQFKQALGVALDKSAANFETVKSVAEDAAKGVIKSATSFAPKSASKSVGKPPNKSPSQAPKKSAIKPTSQTATKLTNQSTPKSAPKLAAKSVNEPSTNTKIKPVTKVAPKSAAMRNSPLSPSGKRRIN
ncbi:MAG: hypothetical protein K0R08_2094 [Solimicrobium sp.]|nr:hypothetical protein [Solimicrobium sp.]